MEVMVAILVFSALILLIWMLSRNAHGKDDTHFLQNIMKAAEAGDPIAQFKLAAMYYEGNGFPRNDSEAMKWYLKAAQQDHIEAQYILGAMYEKGEGAAKDDDQAYKWFSMAARQGYARARTVLESDKWIQYTQVNKPSEKQVEKGVEDVDALSSEQIDEYARKAQDGDVDAQYNLGIIYYHGEGVPKDFEQALSWFLMAAEQNDADAQYNLGFMYGRGEGVTKNREQSIQWFKKAADQGHVGAQEILEKMMRKAQV